MAVPVIEVQALTKNFNSVAAVDDVSFNVNEGEVFGFIGPNGAGKTTTMNILTTLIPPTSGTAIVAGHDIVASPDLVREAIGVVFQDPTLDIRLTGRENLQFHAVIYHVPKPERAGRLDFALRLVELTDTADNLVETYSGGMKRRLELARGLIHKPRVFFLDEPTLGLDPQTRFRIWDYLHELASAGMTVFFTTHYMDEAEQCDRVAIIDQGRIIALDTPAALKKQTGTKTMDGVFLALTGKEIRDGHAAPTGLSAIATRVHRGR